MLRPYCEGDNPDDPQSMEAIIEALGGKPVAFPYRTTCCGSSLMITRKEIAETMSLAPAWDSAAAGWERVIEGVQGGALESETRFQVARARFRAWQRDASEKRVARAVQALRTFLAHAPQGAERDSAQAWLTRLKK